MLARSRRISLAGADIETPLLVPAISSKALGPVNLGRASRKDEVAPASKVHTETFIHGIDEAVLLSAYDIHFGFIADSERLRSGFADSRYATPQLLIIDSGWYEKSVGPDSGEWYYEVGPSIVFEEADYIALVDSLDPAVQAVIVGWDPEGDPKYDEQIDKAQDFFGARKRFGSEILLKPEGERRRYHDFSNLSAATAGRLRAFDVIGVTEKELGDSVLKRLTTLAELRTRLNEAGVQTPIHVFGGLDLLATPLYFAAGGEIFDGLTWLRYAFRGGLSLYRESAPILDGLYEKRFARSLTSIQLQNLDVLAELGRELKVCFHNDMDWTKLHYGDVLRRAYEAMESAMGRQRGR